MLSAVYADIVTDGTVGSAQTLNGPAFVIPESLGSRAGANLFHSFQRFDIGNGEQATFTGSASIANVISRVTGGESSNIDGLLRSNIGRADFYLLNPAGVVFGANARLDVPASFYTSTADELRFPDGSVYSAMNPSASTLSIDQPEAFGFLGDQTASITINQSNFSLTPGKTLSLNGGAIAIENANIQIDAGEIHINAVGDTANTITVSGNSLNPNQGQLNINNSLINTSGNGGGQIAITSGQSKIQDSNLFADNTGTIDADATKGIDIQADSLTIDHSLVSTDTFGSGQQAANLNINATDKLTIINGGNIRSTTFALGNAGDVNVNAGQLLIDSEGNNSLTGITSDAFRNSTGHAGNVNVRIDDNLSLVNAGKIRSNTFGTGNAGSVNVEADRIMINGNSVETGILSDANSGSRGNSGNISVTALQDISLLSGGVISATTFGTGNAGNIEVAAEQLTIDELGSGRLTGILNDTESNAQGHAGTVTVDIKEELTLLGGGAIRSMSFSNGNAGNITIEANDLTIDGQNSIFATGILSDAFGTGSSGNISVVVDNALKIINQHALISSRSIFSQGAAGKISVEAGNMTLSGTNTQFLSGITTSTFSNSDAGDLFVSVGDTLNILKNAQIISSSIFSEGNSGTVTVQAGNLTLDGKDGDFFTLIGSSAQRGSSGGNSGNVIVTVLDNLKILNGAEINTSTFSSGRAGFVKVNSNRLLIDGNNLAPDTGIFSTALSGSSGQSGSISISANDILLTRGGEINIQSLPIVDAATVETMQATEINISAENLTLTDSSISTESFGNTPAGSINLNIDNRLSLYPSEISTASNNADGGAISIQAKLIDLQDSQITTSVSGQGDGGNIIVDGDVLVLDSGFLQANTGGINARGGDISINIDALVTSHNDLLTGGNTPLNFQPGLNVIQAAAPDGVSGNIDFSTPQLDISGDLIDLDSALLNVDDLVQNPCATRGGKQSTLVSLGRGGLPESPAHAGAIVMTPERLQRLLPLPDVVPNPQSGSHDPTRISSQIEPNTWLTRLEPDCL